MRYSGGGDGRRLWRTIGVGSSELSFEDSPEDSGMTGGGVRVVGRAAYLKSAFTVTLHAAF